MAWHSRGSMVPLRAKVPTGQWHRALPGTAWHLPGPAADCEPANGPKRQRAIKRADFARCSVVFAGRIRLPSPANGLTSAVALRGTG